MKKTTTIEIIERGLMLSDYFSGTFGVMLPVYVTPATSVKEVVDTLEKEINQVWDYIEYTAEVNGFSGNLEKAVDNEIFRIKKHIFDNKTGNNIAFPDMDYSEDAENAVLIFTIEFKE